jgi:hypothetical protein
MPPVSARVRQQALSGILDLAELCGGEKKLRAVRIDHDPEDLQRPGPGEVAHVRVQGEAEAREQRTNIRLYSRRIGPGRRIVVARSRSCPEKIRRGRRTRDGPSRVGRPPPGA